IILVLLALLVLFGACSDMGSPVVNQENRNVLKSITKWQVNVSTNQKKSVVMFQEFDRSGRLTFNEEYNEIGIIKYKSSYSYTGNNESKEIFIEFDAAGNEKQQSINEYKFDNKGRVVKKIALNGAGEACKETVYQYDELGNIIKRSETDVKTNNTVVFDYSYTYSSAGNLVERTIKSSNGNTFSRDSLVYSPGNSGLDIINYNDEGITYIKSYKYNSAGRIITEFESTSDGILVRKFIYEYSYFSSY
ncbi:MAG: hypothetical protein IAE98_06800, partial [Candidatus Kapabacteria bacterium]|nr:hypothetical protein [Candidatus Kapabacteria bacterium]